MLHLNPNNMNPAILKPITAEGEQEFLTEIDTRDVSLIGFGENAKVESIWRYDLDLRNYGIKDISIFTVQARAIIYNENGDEIEVFDTLENDGWTVEDKGISDIKIGESILPIDACVDVEDKSIIINW